MVIRQSRVTSLSNSPSSRRNSLNAIGTYFSDMDIKVVVHGIAMAIVIGVIGWVGLSVNTLNTTMAGVQRDIVYLTQGLAANGNMGNTNDAELRNLNTRLSVLEAEAVRRSAH